MSENDEKLLAGLRDLLAVPTDGEDHDCGQGVCILCGRPLDAEKNPDDDSADPFVCSHPGTAVSSAGAEVVAFAATAGLILDPWQQFVLDIMLGERADGRWAASSRPWRVEQETTDGP